MFRQYSASTQNYLFFFDLTASSANVFCKRHRDAFVFHPTQTVRSRISPYTWGRPLSRIAIPHIFCPHPRAHPLAMKFKSTYFLPTSTCPSACRDARSERPGNFVYNQSETDFLICRTLRPSVPTESGALCRTHAKTKHGLSQNKTWPFTTRNATFHKTKCGKRRCRLPHSTLWFAKIKPINGFRSVYGS